MDHLKHKSAIKSIGKDCDETNHLSSYVKGVIITLLISLHIVLLELF